MWLVPLLIFFSLFLKSCVQNLFSELQVKQKEFCIDDIQLGLTTLEEVFLNVTEKKELPNPLIDDGVMILKLESGLALLVVSLTSPFR